VHTMLCDTARVKSEMGCASIHPKPMPCQAVAGSMNRPYIPKAWAQTMMVAINAAMPANSVMSSMIKRAMETSIG